MKMLVSMLLMGLVNNGSTVRRGALLRKPENRLLADRTGTRELPFSPRETGRVMFDTTPALPLDDVPEALLRQYEIAQSRGGRLALTAYISAQRIRLAIANEVPPILKRAIDICASVLLLLALSPLFALIAILVKLEDGGPVFFAQTRVGLKGREFKMFKVRSMCLDAEEKLEQLLKANEHKEGVTFKLKEDPRITKAGRWLRKLSFDELPQLYNVLIGNMSLVGPRPPVPREVAMYSVSDRRRLSIKPGITCIWQVSGRSEIDFSGQVKLDVDYIETQSLSRDVNILLRTLPAVVSGKGAC